MFLDRNNFWNSVLNSYHLHYVYMTVRRTDGRSLSFVMWWLRKSNSRNQCGNSFSVVKSRINKWLVWSFERQNFGHLWFERQKFGHLEVKNLGIWTFILTSKIRSWGRKKPYGKRPQYLKYDVTGRLIGNYWLPHTNLGRPLVSRVLEIKLTVLLYLF